MILSQVEDNMYFSDSVIVDNLMLADYLVKKVKSLMEGKYKDVQGYMGITCLPTMIDSEIVLKNVEYEPENALFVKKESIHSPAVNDLIEETEKAALKLKEEYLKNKIVESEVKKEDAKEEKTVKVKSKTKPKTKTKKETSIVNKPKKKKIVNKKQTTKKTANARTRK
jgi:outer membrane biosynthesis protein TonB